ncbi:MAG: hypothetical protein JXR91_12350 [Deltaproteobacteria bacterium]|nr:hypothetical protein [Deltaproteobacteria bacterium]
MKKMSFLVLFISLSAMLLSGCAGSTEDRVYSLEPTDEHAITYLLTEFEAVTNNNAETLYSKLEGIPNGGGYFYTYDDPTITIDDIEPWAAESPHCTECDPDVAGAKCCTKDLAPILGCEVGSFTVPPEKCGVATGIKTKKTDPFTFFGSTTSMNIKGETAGNGVGLGIYFADDHSYNDKGKEPRALGTSGAKGVTFWATGTGTLVLSLNMPETAPISDGGECDEEAGEKCFDFHKVEFKLDGAWREYWASWDDFKQEGWGIQAKLDPDRFINIQFKVLAADDGSASKFDIWLDHLGFYGGDMWPHTTYMADTEVAVDTTPEDTGADTTPKDTGDPADTADTATDAPVDTATDSDTSVDTATDSATDSDTATDTGTGK